MFLDSIHRLYSFQSDVNKQLMAHVYEVSDEDFDSVDNFHKKAEAEVSAFVSPLNTDGDLERIYQRHATPDELRTRVLWEMMLHVINHGTQHRSDVAMMLTKLGHSPGDMEIL